MFVYGTGGFAYGDVTQRVGFQTAAPLTYSAAARGWTPLRYGGGIEYACPPTRSELLRSNAVTIKAEYLRYDLGSHNLLVGSVGAGGSANISRFRTRAPSPAPA